MEYRLLHITRDDADLTPRLFKILMRDKIQIFNIERDILQILQFFQASSWSYIFASFRSTPLGKLNESLTISRKQIAFSLA